MLSNQRKRRRRRASDRNRRSTLELPEIGPLILRAIGKGSSSNKPTGNQPTASGDPGTGNEHHYHNPTCKIHGKQSVAACPETSPPRGDQRVASQNTRTHGEHQGTTAAHANGRTDQIVSGATEASNSGISKENFTENSGIVGPTSRYQSGCAHTSEQQSSPRPRNRTQRLGTATVGTKIIHPMADLSGALARFLTEDERRSLESAHAMTSHDTACDAHVQGQRGNVASSHNGGAGSMQFHNRHMQAPQQVIDNNNGEVFDTDRDSDLHYAEIDETVQLTYINGSPPAVTMDKLTTDKTSSETVDVVPVRRGRCRNSPRLLLSVACFMATLSMLFSVNTDLLPLDECPIALGSLLPASHLLEQTDPVAVVVLIVMWGSHFLRRFTEILFLHDYRRRLHPVEALWFNIYYTAFGFWIGWSCNYFSAYRTPQTTILIPSVAIFVLGEVGNCVCHVRLKRMRKNAKCGDGLLSQSQHVQPTGFLFNHVLCPQYVFEFVTWLGFAFATFTYPAFLFLVINSVLLLIYAWLRKLQYQREFSCSAHDGTVPSVHSRKALIPGVF